MEKYISTLLYRNDCVIIPGLGGIVANYKAAYLSPAYHTFFPPSKRLAFNTSLQHNDGLLAHLISRMEDISYAEACIRIKSWVDNSFDRMTQGEKIQVPDIGSWSYDLEKNIQFIPDQSINFLTTSFGLSPVQSPAIRREPVQILHRIPRKEKKNRVIPWRLTELVPAAAVLAFFIFNNVNVNPFQVSVADLNPFKKIHFEELASESKSSSTPSIINPFGTQKSATPSSGKSIPESENISAVQKPVTQQAMPVEATIEGSPVAIEAPAPEAKSPAVANENIRLFYVIGGCFGVYENAVNFRDQALETGLQAAIIGQNPKGLYMVSLFSSPDSERAKTELANIKGKFQKGAWLLSE